jgi:transcriptional regulator with XRE-family HTH domain
MALASAAVAERIRRWREQRGWTARQLADECARAGLPALTRSTIAKIESGVRKSVSAEEVATLARVFGVTPAALLGTELDNVTPEPATDDLARRTQIVVDIAEFTRQIDTDQLALRTGLLDVLRQALDEAGIDWESSHIEDRGDGVLILPKVTPQASNAAALPDRLGAALRRYNATHSSNARLRLRIAMNKGAVQSGAYGFTGSELNKVFRLLDARVLKDAMAESDGVLGLVVSDEFYRDVIASDPTAQPADYRPTDVAVKEFSESAWIRVVRSESRTTLFDQASERWLAGLLRTDQFADAGAAYRVAAGWQPPPVAGDDPMTLFEAAAQFNAGPSGVPPALLFVSCLATQAPPRLAAELRSWARLQATRLQVAEQLDAMEPELARLLDRELRAEASLTFQIDLDPIDPDLNVVTVWRELGESGQRRVADIVCRAAELSHRVSELVVDAEASWPSTTTAVRLEFLLPRALLDLPVDRWASDPADPMSMPLGVNYQVSVRSLDRMRRADWHRKWRYRWETLATHQIAVPLPDDVVLAAGSGEVQRLGATLAARQERVAVLLTPPPNALVELDAVRAGVAAGVPVMLWHRGSRPFEETVSELHRLVTRPGDLRENVRLLRAEAFMAGSTATSIGNDLTLMWDDPHRLIPVAA